MKSLVLAAGLLAAAATTTARAADLDQGPPPDRYGAYEDQRYYDMYAHPQPPAYAPPAPRYGGPPVPPGYVYRDQEGDYRGRHAYAEPRDFHDAEERGEFATIIAHRPNGRPFALTLERCSGEVVDARPLDQGHFAYSPPPRRWERPY